MHDHCCCVKRPQPCRWELAVRVTGIHHQSPRWKLAFVGGVVGELFGVIFGPIAMFAFVVCEKYLYGANPPGILLFISPILALFLVPLRDWLLAPIGPSRSCGVAS